VLSDPEIDAVAIATPAVTHYSMATAALSAGKHTFIEKPMALHHAEAEALVSLADTQRLTLMVGHLLRYHPAVTALQDMVHGGELGSIRYIHSRRLNLGAIRTDENVLWSFAPHDLSVVLSLVGEMPVRVSASGGAYLQSDIEDMTSATLQFPGNTQGQVTLSWLHPFKVQELVVVGSKKMAVFDDVSRDAKLVVYDHGIDFSDGQFAVERNEGTVVPLPDAEPLQQECSHFLECVASGQRPRTDGREGLRVLSVLQACQASMDTQGAWVDLGAVAANVPHD
jgi:UDP-2-acetamido-3-amino-2,3-dideoxy-glucuronate N-acetyltransferase